MTSQIDHEVNYIVSDWSKIIELAPGSIFLDLGDLPEFEREIVPSLPGGST